MLNMNFKTALFDLDGTVLNTGEGITKGVTHAIRVLGLPDLTDEEKAMFVGPPMRGSYKKYCGLSDEEAEEALRVYREYYSETGLYEFYVYEGMEELLIQLTKMGVEIILATLKPTEYAEKMLQRAGLTKYFKEIIGATMDKSRDSKAKIVECALSLAKDKNAVMIGDTKFDVEGAKENGIPTIGVLYGFGCKQELLDSKPEYIAENVSDIIKFFA